MASSSVASSWILQGTVRMEVATCSLTGRRSANEDGVLARSVIRGRRLLAVADGMGGHAGGAEASRVALAALEEALADGANLAVAVGRANAAVRAAALELGHERMGTTLVAALQSGPRYRIANAGDSRAYRIDGQGIQLLTRDHSALADAQRGDPQAARALANSPWRHAVTRALGLEPSLDVDLFGPFDALTPHTLLLSSDGLHDHLPEPEMAHSLSQAPDLETAAQRLAHQAYERGSPDNISVVLGRFSPAA